MFYRGITARDGGTGRAWMRTQGREPVEWNGLNERQWT